MKRTLSVLRIVNYIKLIIIVFITGCSNLSDLYEINIKNTNVLYVNDAFPGADNVYIESQEQIFAIDNEMKSMVRYLSEQSSNEEDKAQRLLEYIFSSDHIAMSYENNANVTAIDAFHGRKANCMSLTIMAYVLAKEAGMSLKFQHVNVPEYWVRNGERQLLMGHVNLLVIKKPKAYASFNKPREILQIDFDPSAIKKEFSKNIISKNKITSMFYNNKGAEALVNGDYDSAYAYLRAATKIAPKFASPWGNLAVLYKINNYHELAINTYKYTLMLNPDELSALENLSLLFAKIGNNKDANKINYTLHAKRVLNPYYHVLLSDEANHNGKPLNAIKHIKKAITLQNTAHEFYYQLAKLYFKTQQLELAQFAIKKALRLNKNLSTEIKYNKKLSFLNQASVQY